MRRFLSWVVLYVMNFVFYYVEYFVWYAGLYLFARLLNAGTLVFWLVLLLGGGELLLGLIYSCIMYGSLAVIRCSQAVWKSWNGTRYKVIGILNILTYAGYILGALALGMSGRQLLNCILACVTMIIFGIILIAERQTIVDEDGLPPTKRERLQAKLDRLDREEQNRWN